jgi:hypothetical protein
MASIVTAALGTGFSGFGVLSTCGAPSGARRGEQEKQTTSGRYIEASSRRLIGTGGRATAERGARFANRIPSVEYLGCEFKRLTKENSS